MQNKNELIKKKIFGLIESIEKMSANEKRKEASVDYGNEINKLFKIVRETNPELNDFLPSNLEFDSWEYGEYVSTNWSEIHSKLNQIYQLLS